MAGSCLKERDSPILTITHGIRREKVLKKEVSEEDQQIQTFHMVERKNSGKVTPAWSRQ